MYADTYVNSYVKLYANLYENPGDFMPGVNDLKISLNGLDSLLGNAIRRSRRDISSDLSNLSAAVFK